MFKPKHFIGLFSLVAILALTTSVVNNRKISFNVSELAKNENLSTPPTQTSKQQNLSCLEKAGSEPKFIVRIIKKIYCIIN